MSVEPNATVPSNPHDAVFRRILGKPENAASQLRAVLPPELVARLDLDRLRLCDGNFVDTALRFRQSDLLFTVPLDERDAFIYVLEEHQSSDDPMMAFRVLHYIVRIWDRYLRGNPRAKRLPPVIPLVVHQGRRPWASPTEVFDLLDFNGNTAGLEGCMPRLRFLLEDLPVLNQRVLRERPMNPQTRVLYVLLQTAAKHPRINDELIDWLDDLDAISDQPGGYEDLIALIAYIEAASETPGDLLTDFFSKLGSEAKEAYMTTADMLRAEGEARGEARGKADALVQFMTIKFGPLEPSVLNAVKAASVEEIELWTSRVVTAETLDDVLN